MFIVLQETDIEKFVKLNDSTETHDNVSNGTISRVRSGKHIIIDWETNLLHIMRREYLKTDKCEFTLSTISITLSSRKNNSKEKVYKNVLPWIVSLL